ncbi:MAG: HU family DNA-binding protein [Balneolaceae bacterium]
MEKIFIKAFKETIREEIIKNNTVQIEGFGRFEKEHQNQRQKKFENGKIVLLPPCDKIIFSSEIKGKP